MPKSVYAHVQKKHCHTKCLHTRYASINYDCETTACEDTQIEPTVSGWRITIHQSVFSLKELTFLYSTASWGDATWCHYKSPKPSQTYMYFFKTLVILQWLGKDTWKIAIYHGLLLVFIPNLLTGTLVQVHIFGDSQCSHESVSLPHQYQEEATLAWAFW